MKKGITPRRALVAGAFLLIAAGAYLYQASRDRWGWLHEQLVYRKIGNSFPRGTDPSMSAEVRASRRLAMQSVARTVLGEVLALQERNAALGRSIQATGSLYRPEGTPWIQDFDSMFKVVSPQEVDSMIAKLDNPMASGPA